MLEAREKLWVQGTGRKSSASGERLDWLSAVTLSAVHLSHEQRFYGRNRLTVYIFTTTVLCISVLYYEALSSPFETHQEVAFISQNV